MYHRALWHMWFLSRWFIVRKIVLGFIMPRLFFSYLIKRQSMIVSNVIYWSFILPCELLILLLNLISLSLIRGNLIHITCIWINLISLKIFSRRMFVKFIRTWCWIVWCVIMSSLNRAIVLKILASLHVLISTWLNLNDLSNSWKITILRRKLRWSIVRNFSFVTSPRSNS